MTSLTRAAAFAIACLTLLPLGQPDPVAAPAAPNLFAELLGKSAEEVAAKVERDFQQLFYGDEVTERIYYPVGDDMAYVWDVGNDDVRSEGMSYGMMAAVQLDKKEEFDRIWKWAYTHMRHDSGPLEGYFAWHCRTNGVQISPGSASDGEEWFAMALFFAGKRWGDGEGIFNYTQQANAILDAMLHKTSAVDPRVVSIFDREHKQVRFVPWADWDGVTDPSYHLPAFYELWAKWAVKDRDFWAACAITSRAYFKEVAHPATGLMPDYSYYKPSQRQFGGHKDFRFDAWRVISNVALDHAWWSKDSDWQTMQSERILGFLSGYWPEIPNQFTVDGQPLSKDSSDGLYAMAATGALAASPEMATPFVQRLWDTPPPTGQWRYYDGALHILALLQVSGNFRVFE